MKENRFPTLKTPYIDSMDKITPWNEYPRPSLVRGSFLCLNGLWDFAITNGNDAPIYDKKILVPFPPESLLSGLETSVSKNDVMHYRRNFTVPEGFVKSKFILHFGAVDTISDIYLNGEHIAHNEGGYIPFSVDATKWLIEGENSLYVRVTDSLSTDYPYGKQTANRGGMWYTPVSGIWQTVWAESLPEKYIERIKVTPTLKDVKIEVFGGEEKKTLRLEDKIYEFYGSEFTLTPDEIRLWTPETPNLYYFTIDCGEDRIDSYFALREIGIKEINGVPRLTLNGKPYLFNGLLDQGYFPDGIFLPATSQGYEEDIKKAKSLGFNMLRKHIKIEPEIFYNLCDRLGMIVFQDMVNNSGYSFLFDTALPTIGMKRFPDSILHRRKKSRKIFEESMYSTFRHLYNFPSILYYTIFNEGWGQFSADKMYEKAKTEEPTRIIDTTSGWFVQNKSDVDSRHVYFKAVKLDNITEKPLVISEFGGYSHRVDGHLFGLDNYGYKLFDTIEDFSEAFYKLYEEEILPLIPLGISALVYTQISDVEDETNGLITYDRKYTKLDETRCRALMKRLYDAIALKNNE